MFVLQFGCWVSMKGGWGLRIAWCDSFSKDMGLEQLIVIGGAFCSMKKERNRECTAEQVSNKQKHVK